MSVVEPMILEFKRKNREGNIHLGVNSIFTGHLAMRLSEVSKSVKRKWAQRRKMNTKKPTASQLSYFWEKSKGFLV